jgi:hypothetical protein
MRPLLAFAILMLGLSTAAPEPEYSRLLRGTFHAQRDAAFTSLVEIESSTGRGDRRPLLIPASAEVMDDDSATTSTLDRAPAMPLPPSADIHPDSDAPAAANPGASAPAAGESNSTQQVSLPDLCNALLTSAEQNDLPVAFFANLIWQESRLRDNAVSPKGALGIAQFMPQVAAQNGLQNPLDPMQALPASARLLRSLRDQFRNLGFVAAAYNAGAGRVAQWLEHRRTLPRETRGYVLHITGRSVEEWRKMPVDDASLHFVRRLPCRELPEFADLERAQQEAQAAEEQARRAQAEEQRQAQAEQQAAQHKKEPPQTEATVRVERKHVIVREGVAEREYVVPHERVAERGHGRNALLHRASLRVAEREHHHSQHEAKQHLRRGGHEGHRRV